MRDVRAEKVARLDRIIDALDNDDDAALYFLYRTDDIVRRLIDLGPRILRRGHST